MAGLPALLPWQDIQTRLQAVFPAGSTKTKGSRLVSVMAARTIYTFLYVNAVEGSGILLAPKHVYRMTEEQTGQTADADRLSYAAEIMKANGKVPGNRWYEDNSREGVRDDTIREAFVVVGAVLDDDTVPTTSGKGRYSLQTAFAALFDPALDRVQLEDAVKSWQAKHLTAGAIARVAVVRAGAAKGGEQVSVIFPSGETRRLKAGPSSNITKAVIEVFAPRFLGDPAVLFLSESGNKVVARDEHLLKAIGLTINAQRELPDLILVDLKPAQPLLVFVEVVATDGPIGDRRKEALEKIATEGKFDLQNVAFVTAYLDRSRAPFKQTVEMLAYGTFAWFMGEPELLMELSGPARTSLR
ncbi:restriction endonuclease [Mesorhizobium sp. B2-1-3A]|nr:restriction endonuclease [Mesorhizobium sp. B2-1-3A]